MGGQHKRTFVTTSLHYHSDKNMGSVKPTENIEIIAEDQVAPDTLRDLFRRAFFVASLDDDGDVRVETDDPTVFVSINADNKLLKYTTVYGFKSTASLELKHSFVNKMNDDVIFCRFSVPEEAPAILMVDYYLPFGEGVPAFQVVRALRFFARVVPRAIYDCDDNDLIG